MTMTAKKARSLMTSPQVEYNTSNAGPLFDAITQAAKDNQSSIVSSRPLSADLVEKLTSPIYGYTVKGETISWEVNTDTAEADA